MKMSIHYILDSNTLIDLNRVGYPLNEEKNQWFWNYILSLAQQNFIKVPETVCEELSRGTDKLSEWIKLHRQEIILHTRSVLGKEYRSVVNTYTSFSLDGKIQETDVEFLDSSADPYVIAHAMKESGEVVSSERENNATRPKNVKIPSVCKKLGLPCKHLVVFIWEISEKHANELKANS